MALHRRLRPALEEHPDLLLFPVTGDVALGPKTVVEPDLLVIARPPALEAQWSELKAPLLAVEIRSGEGGGNHLKRRLYQEAGVSEYWVVDLEAKQVERWRPEDQLPEIVTDRLTWQITESSPPFELDLGSYFEEVIEGR